MLHIGWEQIAAGLGGLTMLLLSYFIRRQGVHEERRQTQYKEILDKIDGVTEKLSAKLTGKIDVGQCLDYRTACRAYTEGALSTPLADKLNTLEREIRSSQEILGEAINNHSHTGLERDAAVIVNHNMRRK